MWFIKPVFYSACKVCLSMHSDSRRMVVSYFLFIKILFVSFNIYRCVACMCVVCSVHGAQQVALDLLELELQVVAETPCDEYWESNPSTLRAVSTFNESHFTLQNPNMNQLSVVCPWVG